MPVTREPYILLLLLSCAACTSGTNDSRTDIIQGLVEGFISKTPDLANCIGGNVTETHTFGTAIEGIVKAITEHDVKGLAVGLRELAGAIDSLPDVAGCQAAEADVKDIRNTLKGIRNLTDLETHIWHDIVLNSKDIENEIAVAAAAGQMEDYHEMGRRIGVILRLGVVGTAGVGPQPPPPHAPYNQQMYLRDLSQMVPGEPGDEFEVHWLLSPLYMELLKDWGGALGLVHISLGFRNLRTGLNSTFEFAADNFNAALILPARLDSNGSITWNNTGTLKAKEGQLDLNYWQFRVKLATVNASTYNSMLSWMEVAKLDYTHYYLFGLMTVASADTKPKFPGRTCFEFAYDAVQELTRLAGPCVLDRSLPGLVHNDILFLKSSNDVAEPASDQEAFRFYSAAGNITALWSFKLEDTIAEIERLARERRDGKMVFYNTNGTYLAFTPHRPFLTIRKTFAPLPGLCYSESFVV